MALKSKMAFGPRLYNYAGLVEALLPKALTPKDVKTSQSDPLKGYAVWVAVR